MQNHSALAYGKKLFSLSLIFNALVSITYAAGLLTGFYVAHWALYPPFVLNGNLFWLAVAASLLNIFPAAYFGQVKTGRLWFHHYVYGFIVLVLSVVPLMLFTSVSLIALFTSNITDMTLNVGKFFVLGGMALVLDDLPDVHHTMQSTVTWLKSKAHRIRKTVHALQLVLGLATLYLFLAVTAYMVVNPQWATPANCILAGTFFVTSLTSFAAVKRKVWLNLDTKSPEPH